MPATYCVDVEYWFPSRSFKYKLRCVFQNLLFVISMWNRELPFFAYLVFDLIDRKAISWSRRKQKLCSNNMYIFLRHYSGQCLRIAVAVHSVRIPNGSFFNVSFSGKCAVSLFNFFFHSPSSDAREIFLFCKFK